MLGFLGMIKPSSIAIVKRKLEQPLKFPFYLMPVRHVCAIKSSHAYSNQSRHGSILKFNAGGVASATPHLQTKYQCLSPYSLEQSNLVLGRYHWHKRRSTLQYHNPLQRALACTVHLSTAIHMTPASTARPA